MLDIEYNPNGATCYGLSQAAMRSWIKDFGETYKAKAGRYPMIYTTLGECPIPSCTPVETHRQMLIVFSVL
jgi:GH25 family lysozyme M1 (1,4-beta-N-acetylmuramidase)